MLLALRLADMHLVSSSNLFFPYLFCCEKHVSSKSKMRMFLKRQKMECWRQKIYKQKFCKKAVKPVRVFVWNPTIPTQTSDIGSNQNSICNMESCLNILVRTYIRQNINTLWNHRYNSVYTLSQKIYHKNDLLQ